MPTQYAVLDTNGKIKLVDAPSFGIGIQDYEDHQSNTEKALQDLVATPSGKALIESILLRIKMTEGKTRVGITRWDAQQLNKCATATGSSDDTKVPLAYALEFARGKVADELGAAMRRAGKMDDAQWLATQMRAHPVIDIMGAPKVMASVHTLGVDWVTTDMVEGWLAGTPQFPAPLNNAQAKQAHCIIISLLKDHLGSGAGAGARVNWSVASKFFTDTGGNLRKKTPYVSLGHELIHAWRNIWGTQVGHDIDTYTRVLYEWSCVGLGRWEGQMPSENSIRLDAKLEKRPMY